MKKVFGILFCLAVTFNNLLQAQCSVVTVEAYQISAGNYKVRATLAYLCPVEVSVNGSITEPGGPTDIYTITIPANSITGQTNDTWQMSATPDLTISNVLPCPGFYLEEFFLSFSLSELQNSDSIEVENYLKGKNQELLNYLSANFSTTFNPDSVSNDSVTLMWAGFIHMLAEGEGAFNESFPIASAKFLEHGPKADLVSFFQLKSKANFRLEWSCVRGILEAAFDITSLIEDYVALINGGGTWKSVGRLIWRTAKRYLGWLGVAGVIYDVATNCLD
jgi:hypothetical protein